MNLKDGDGRVPIRNSTQHEATPYLLVDFPLGKDFDALYPRIKLRSVIEKYWIILSDRSAGKTLAESGKKFGLTRERVRQIEAKFQRLVGEQYWRGVEKDLARICELQHLAEPFLNSEKP